ncbi:MAG: hypothetical protein HKP58_00180 [Desulfatitalea sp.]|nr:hypothetical protein [Desulfatitalea sp.]NNJ98806.1 hypothetical protein [Desulfatitalea sp.]
MISSPCKSCQKRYLPKDLCLEKCDKIRGVQALQRTMPISPYASIDSTDSIRYRLAIPVSMPRCE